MYNTIVAYILFFISGFGALGFHRFYLGKIGTGLLWMFSGGMAMIGSIYDFFTLPRQVKEANIRQAILEESVRSRANKRQFQGSPDWRRVENAETRIVREKESAERVILRIAKANKGILTASEVALSADIPIEEAKKNLDALVSKGYAELRVRQSGSLVYTIPDLMDSDEPLVDM
ncbi:MAG: TM2 domain-containing protein [Treponema sp.]|nr:TM2 domain-containing protein [Treponema sp.]